MDNNNDLDLKDTMNEKNRHFNLLEQAFPGIKANISRCEKLGFNWVSKPFIKKDNRTAISHVGFLEYPLIIENELHKVAALHAVCTEKNYQDQGNASQLIQEALAWAKGNYECVLLFTDIPKFYEKLLFHRIQEYRFRLTCEHKEGKKISIPMVFPDHNAIFLQLFGKRVPVSHNIWIKDHGFVASFNALFMTYPLFWSLYYCPSIDTIIAYEIEDKSVHIYDIIGSEIPSLELILEHIPSPVKEIYFYFSPDTLTAAAIPEPHLFDNGQLMVHGEWPSAKEFMISPLSRC